jgi:nucleotide-binding universal stress UspA family protein
MRNIVVPIDFSKTSITAIKFGTYLAGLMQLNMRIVHVSDLVLSGDHSLTTPEQKRDETRLEERLTDFASANIVQDASPSADSGNFVPQVNLSVISGMAASQILSLSEETTTAFIVMGGVGAGAGIHPPGLYGSVATPVALRGACPVILIPKEYRFTNIERLAIAFDDADEIIRISEFSKSIIKALKPEVRYVHVSKANWRKEIENEDDFMDITWKNNFPGYSYEFDILAEGDVADQLRQYTKEMRIELLVLGGKRQGFWRRLFDVHHLKPIIKSSEIPMLVIPFSASED